MRAAVAAAPEPIILVLAVLVEPAAAAPEGEWAARRLLEPLIPVEAAAGMALSMANQRPPAALVLSLFAIPLLKQRL